MSHHILLRVRDNQIYSKNILKQTQFKISTITLCHEPGHTKKMKMKQILRIITSIDKICCNQKV